MMTTVNKYGFSLRDQLLGPGHKMHMLDEMSKVSMWCGREEVNAREKVRVESGDPSLISVAAKLSALEHEVRRWRFNPRLAIGEDEDEEQDQVDAGWTGGNRQVSLFCPGWPTGICRTASYYTKQQFVIA